MAEIKNICPCGIHIVQSYIVRWLIIRLPSRSMLETAADIEAYTLFKVAEVNNENLSGWHIVQNYIVRWLIIRLPPRSMSETAADIEAYTLYKVAEANQAVFTDK